MPRYHVKLELDQDYEADSEEEAIQEFCQDNGLLPESVVIQENCEVEEVK